jgi:hypothetical protein
MSTDVHATLVRNDLPFGSDVHNEDSLSFEVGEVKGFAIRELSLEGVECRVGHGGLITRELCGDKRWVDAEAIDWGLIYVVLKATSAEQSTRRERVKHM